MRASINTINLNGSTGRSEVEAFLRVAGELGHQRFKTRRLLTDAGISMEVYSKPATTKPSLLRGVRRNPEDGRATLDKHLERLELDTRVVPDQNELNAPGSRGPATSGDLCDHQFTESPDGEQRAKSLRDSVSAGTDEYGLSESVSSHGSFDEVDFEVESLTELVTPGLEGVELRQLQARPEHLEGLRRSTVVGPAEACEHRFPGDEQPRPAWRHKVVVGKREIPLIVAQAGPAAELDQPPSVQSVARAVGMLTDDLVRNIDEIAISPEKNPEAGNHIAASGNHKICFFPTRHTGQTVTDVAMVHEGGHLLHESVWGHQGESKRWKRVFESDEAKPSRYAQENVREDFAESVVLHVMSKGTPLEEGTRRRYPLRYRELDRIATVMQQYNGNFRNYEIQRCVGI